MEISIQFARNKFANRATPTQVRTDGKTLPAYLPLENLPEHQLNTLMRRGDVTRTRTGKLLVNISRPHIGWSIRPARPVMGLEGMRYGTIICCVN